MGAKERQRVAGGGLGGSEQGGFDFGEVEGHNGSGARLRGSTSSPCGLLGDLAVLVAWFPLAQECCCCRLFGGGFFGERWGADKGGQVEADQGEDQAFEQGSGGVKTFVFASVTSFI